MVPKFWQSQRKVLCRENKNRYYLVVLKIVDPPINRNKSFSFSTYGSKENAYTAAREYLDQLNTEYNLTHIIQKCYFSSYVREYIAGFLDGDGCIGISGAHSFTASFAQSSDSGVPTVLDRVRSLYGGDIRQKKVYGNRRVPYELVIRGEKTLPILYDMKDTLVMKHEQARSLYEFLRDRKENQEDLASMREKLCRLKTEYASAIIDSTKITSAYLGGLVDAEGYILPVGWTAARVEISQDSCPPLLNAINSRYGDRGYNSGRSVFFNGELSYDFLQEIRNYTCVKRSQIDAVLEIRKYRGLVLSSQDKEEIFRLQSLVQSEKRK